MHRINARGRSRLEKSSQWHVEQQRIFMPIETSVKCQGFEIVKAVDTAKLNKAIDTAARLRAIALIK